MHALSSPSRASAVLPTFPVCTVKSPPFPTKMRFSYPPPRKIVLAAARSGAQGKVRRVSVVLRLDVLEHLHLVERPTQAPLHPLEELHALLHRHPRRRAHLLARRHLRLIRREVRVIEKRIRAESVVRLHDSRFDDGVLEAPRGDCVDSLQERAAHLAARGARRLEHLRVHLLIRGAALVKLGREAPELPRNLAVPSRLPLQRANHVAERGGLHSRAAGD
mmetsp:Transcript_14541/g.61409  ORF Transcript_14541/g.61409 Transcript_14541/m.61409 type:complete len:220 (-) Transcript_14541:2550-3209(-)